MSYSTPRVKIAIGLALLGFGAVACAGDDVDQTASSTIDVSESSRLLDVEGFVDFLDATPSAVLVNVHIPYEGHIDDTDAFVPFDEIGSWDELPTDRDAPVALYCRSGSMSADAVETLVRLGYTGLVELQGGMNAWVAAGEQLQTTR